MSLTDKNFWGGVRHLFLARKQVIFRHERGQDLIEFALVLPLLFLFLFGALDFGRAFFSYIVITNAAREGARYGISDGLTINPVTKDYLIETSMVVSMVRREASQSGVDLSTANISVTTPEGLAAGRVLRVGIELPFRPILTGFISSSNLTIRRAVEMLIP